MEQFVPFQVKYVIIFSHFNPPTLNKNGDYLPHV